MYTVYNTKYILTHLTSFYQAKKERIFRRTPKLAVSNPKILMKNQHFSFLAVLLTMLFTLSAVPLTLGETVPYQSIYYVDDETHKIQWANVDGTNIKDLVTDGYPAGIALDVSGGKMYYTDDIRGLIYRADVDGSNVIDIITDLRAPVRLALGTTSPGLWDLDVNQDGSITYIDIITLALYYGVSVDAGVNLRADVNKDGRVDIKDLIVVARAVDAAAAAPALVQQRNRLPFTAQEVAAWIRDAKHQQLSVRRIAVLERVLEVLTRSEMPLRKTALLANYPNPFNPETWIPRFQRAELTPLNASRRVLTSIEESTSY